MNRLWIALALILAATGAYAGHPNTTCANYFGVYCDALTADTGGTEEWIVLPDGMAHITVAGTGGNNFGGGTAIVQQLLPDGTEKTVDTASWTADAIGRKLELGGCALVRVQFTGSTSPSFLWKITPHKTRTQSGDAHCQQYVQ